jgi:hypothetical protein
MLREHLEALGIYERIILKCIFKKWNGGVSWIDLAQNRGQAACSYEFYNDHSDFI